jgi:hypothetical protein
MSLGDSQILEDGDRLENSRTRMQTSRETLAAMTDINVSKEGIISITAWGFDPKTALEG